MTTPADGEQLSFEAHIRAAVPRARSRFDDVRLRSLVARRRQRERRRNPDEIEGRGPYRATARGRKSASRSSRAGLRPASLLDRALLAAQSVVVAVQPVRIRAENPDGRDTRRGCRGSRGRRRSAGTANRTDGSSMTAPGPWGRQARAGAARALLRWPPRSSLPHRVPVSGQPLEHRSGTRRPPGSRRRSVDGRGPSRRGARRRRGGVRSGRECPGSRRGGRPASTSRAAGHAWWPARSNGPRSGVSTPISRIRSVLPLVSRTSSVSPSTMRHRAPVGERSSDRWRLTTRRRPTSAQPWANGRGHQVCTAGCFRTNHQPSPETGEV